MREAQGLSKLLKVSIFAGIFLAGCGTTSSEEAADSNNDAEAQEVIVGTGNAYQPFVYLDENGELTGYDVAVLDAVDEKLPQYTFKYESYDFPNILPALDSDKVQLAAHQYAKNAEREEKYLFGEIGYTNFDLYITSSGDTMNYQTLADLAGKKVMAAPSSNAAYLLEQYNAANGDAIEIIYNGGGQEIVVDGLQKGTFDATLMTKYDVNKLNEQFDAKLVTSEEPSNSEKTYFIFQKGNTELQTAVDGALQELIDEGKLSKISEETLKGDYTK